MECVSEDEHGKRKKTERFKCLYIKLSGRICEKDTRKNERNEKIMTTFAGGQEGAEPDDMGHAWREKVCDEDAQVCVSVLNRLFGVVLTVLKKLKARLC